MTPALLYVPLPVVRCSQEREDRPHKIFGEFLACAACGAVRHA